MSGGVHVFTSAALNYLGKVRVLLRSVVRHHPDFHLHLLLAERPVDRVMRALEAVDASRCEVTFATELASGRQAGWCFGHTLVELATALKPHMALDLLNRPGCERVLYLDPDIVVFSPLDDVLGALDGAAIALTPHLLHPERDAKAVLENEVCALRHGAFNLGFLGLSNRPQARTFLEWWRARTDAHCIDELADALFTDQKWIDLAPGFFDELTILRQARLNVAPWNIGHRPITGSFDEGFRVNGEPLGFYHFTGFDSGAHHHAVTEYAPGNQAVRTLIEWYTVSSTALAPAGPLDWSLGCYEDGTPIATADRRRYRGRPDLQDAFPDPYAVGLGTYRWWQDNNPEGRG